MNDYLSILRRFGIVLAVIFLLLVILSLPSYHLHLDWLLKIFK